MSNHFHIVLYAPGKPPSLEETARRYEDFYEGKRRLSANAPLCAEIAPRLNDISWFMRDLQQRFTVWFNRTRPIRRRGALWADRYKNVLLDQGMALWTALKYIELNPVRAGIVEDPADYRFSSWGMWQGSGKHPFAAAFERHAGRSLGERGRGWTLADLEAEFRGQLARTLCGEAGGSSEEIHDSYEAGKEKEAPMLRLNRRVRYFSDGLIIGSKAFVREVAAQHFPAEKAAKKRLGRGRIPDGGELFSFRRVQTAVG